MPLLTPTARSKDYTALSAWLRAVRDLPIDSIKSLFSGEYLSIENSVQAIVQSIIYPFFKHDYRAEVLVTEASNEIDISAKRIMPGKDKEIALEAAIANVSISTARGYYEQSDTTTLVAGDNWVDLIKTIPASYDYIFDYLNFDGGGFEVLEREPTRFKVNVSVDGILKWGVAPTGRTTSQAVMTAGAQLQDVSIKARVPVLAITDNLIAIGATMLTGYEVTNLVGYDGTDTAIGVEAVNKTTTAFEIDAAATGTAEYELRGQSVIDGSLVGVLEQVRGIVALSAGANTIAFPGGALGDYITPAFWVWNADRVAIGYSVTKSSTGFVITVAEPATLMYRAVEVGVSLTAEVEALNRLAVRIDSDEEWEVVRRRIGGSSNSLKRTILYRVLSLQKIELLKGHGLDNWQAFTLRYPRLTIPLSAQADAIDVPDGVAMSIFIHALRLRICYRFQLLQFAEVAAKEFAEALTLLSAEKRTEIDIAKATKQIEDMR